MQDASKQEEQLESANVSRIEAILAGAIAQTRELARQEVQALESLEKKSPRKTTRTRIFRSNEIRQCDPLTRGEEKKEMQISDAFAFSPNYADVTQIETLKRRPPVQFVLKNHSKEEELSTASTVSQPPSTTGKIRQTWFSPVHIPLTHRKLVESPRIFNGIAPIKPVENRSQNQSTNSNRKRIDTTFKRRSSVDKYVSISLCSLCMD